MFENLRNFIIFDMFFVAIIFINNNQNLYTLCLEFSGSY